MKFLNRFLSNKSQPEIASECELQLEVLESRQLYSAAPIGLPADIADTEIVVDQVQSNSGFEGVEGFGPELGFTKPDIWQADSEFPEVSGLGFFSDPSLMPQTEISIAPEDNSKNDPSFEAKIEELDATKEGFAESSQLFVDLDLVIS